MVYDNGDVWGHSNFLNYSPKTMYFGEKAHKNPPKHSKRGAKIPQNDMNWGKSPKTGGDYA